MAGGGSPGRMPVAGDEVAVSHWGVLKERPVGEGGSPTSPPPPRVEALEVALPRPRVRAQVWPLEERVAAQHSGGRNRAGYSSSAIRAAARRAPWVSTRR